MIRINLLTEKRRKPIPVGIIVPSLLVLAVLVGVGFAWFFGSEYMATYNKAKEEELDEIKRSNQAQGQKIKDRDNLKRDCNRLVSEIRRLNQLSGANKLQWSTSLSALSSLAPEKTVWLTNLRIDSDRRVQMTGYSCNENGKEESKSSGANLSNGIQKFIKQLMDNSYFQEVFMTNATKNVYEKMPVWRFEINCRLINELNNR